MPLLLNYSGWSVVCLKDRPDGNVFYLDQIVAKPLQECLNENKVNVLDVYHVTLPSIWRYGGFKLFPTG